MCMYNIKNKDFKMIISRAEFSPMCYMTKDIHASTCASHTSTKEAFNRVLILKGDVLRNWNVPYLNKKMNQGLLLLSGKISTIIQ